MFILSDINEPTKKRLKAHARRKEATLLTEKKKYKDGYGKQRKRSADEHRRAERLRKQYFELEASNRAA